jgi:hypothetical protein
MRLLSPEMAVVPAVVSWESPDEPHAASNNAHSTTVNARMTLPSVRREVPRLDLSSNDAGL